MENNNQNNQQKNHNKKRHHRRFNKHKPKKENKAVELAEELSAEELEETVTDKDMPLNKEESLEFLWTGWDEEVHGGGIYWDKSYGGKNTCTNEAQGTVLILTRCTYVILLIHHILCKVKSHII